MRFALLVFASLFAKNLSAGGADPSIRIELEKGQTRTFCRAVRVETGNSNRCYAVTARGCLPDSHSLAGTVFFKSQEFGKQSAEYVVTPQEVALLHWSCASRDVRAPHFFLSWTQKLTTTTQVEFGKEAKDPRAPRLLARGVVVEGDDKQRRIDMKGYRPTSEDLGGPLICLTENQESDLCGILISTEHSRFAVGEALKTVRAEMRKLGVKEWASTVVNGRRVPIVEE